MQPTLKRFCTKLGKPGSVASVLEEPFGHSKKDKTKQVCYLAGNLESWDAVNFTNFITQVETSYKLNKRISSNEYFKLGAAI